MNTAIISGEVVSEIKVINTDNGFPFCRFTFNVSGKNHNCIVSGKKAYKFVYEVEEGTGLTVDCTINDRMQLVIQSYKIDSQPIRIGQVWDYKNRLLPHKKIMF